MTQGTEGGRHVLAEECIRYLDHDSPEKRARMLCETAKQREARPHFAMELSGHIEKAVKLFRYFLTPLNKPPTKAT